MTALRTLAAALIVLTLLAAGSAQAARKPTTKDRRAIVAAVKLPSLTYPKGSYYLVVRVSTAHSKRRWAAVYIRPHFDYQDVVQQDVASVVRRRGKWRAHQIGNGGGCGVRRAVRRDLKLDCY
jgi:hypothetical protein